MDDSQETIVDDLSKSDEELDLNLGIEEKKQENVEEKLDDMLDPKSDISDDTDNE